MQTAGNRASELIPLIYEELRRIAARHISRQRPDFTLQATELVHEACLCLIKQTSDGWIDLAHFKAIASRKIWQIVVDHARRRMARRRSICYLDKCAPRAAGAGPDAMVSSRGNGQRLPLDAIVVDWRDRAVDVLDIDSAFSRLAEENKRVSNVVRLHWIAGLTQQETATEIGCSLSQVEKDWKYAKAWLNDFLNAGYASERNGK